MRGIWTVLEACRETGKLVKRIVVTSSDKASGQAPVLPYDEEMRLNGRHPYDASKSCNDIISQTYYHTYKLPLCVTRAGNFYGGRTSTSTASSRAPYAGRSMASARCCAATAP